MERRLTTILAADLVGYSRLMSLDEEGVITRLRAVWSDLVKPAVDDAGGRVIKTMGDGVLAEFPSAVSAVRVAMEIQKGVAGREAAQPEDRRFRFRVGINLGDVVIEGDDVLGDGVNIAARLESLAPPGGICVSRAVHDQVRGKVGADLVAMGPQQVKNIPYPVDTWRLDIGGTAAAETPPKGRERASIAVLPFDNISNDPEQDFLADGLVEDVITELSRFRWLFVIARNSTFTYKNSPKDVREIASELGVRYVVEGSVRRSADRLRVTAQLIDAETGAHVWADRWDRVLADLFDLQDELTAAIITNVEPELGAHERNLARRKPTENLTAWELCQRGYGEFLKYSGEGQIAAEDLLRAAIASDPKFSLPYAHLARVYWYRLTSGRTADPASDSAEGIALARKAVELDDRNETAYLALGVHLVLSGREIDARDALDRCMALNPNNAQLYLGRVIAALFAADPDVEALKAAAIEIFRLSPKDPIAWFKPFFIGIGDLLGLIMDQRLDDPDVDLSGIRSAFEEACRFSNADYYAFVFAATIDCRLGDPEAARRYLREALDRRPDLTVRALESAFSFPSYKSVYAALESDIAALAALGLPVD